MCPLHISKEFSSNTHTSRRNTKSSGWGMKNSPRAAKQLKITGEHTKINIKPNSVMAVVPHHLPSKQIWSDCLIKPAALSAIHTGFLPAEYSIIHVKGLEKQANKGQSELNLWCTNSFQRYIHAIYDPCISADAKAVVVELWGADKYSSVK